MDAYHVYPVNDEHGHYLERVYPSIGMPYCPCECSPKWKEESGSIVIVHNSFDGREGLEWANEILNTTTT